MNGLSAVECYLQDFHQRIVGSTPAAFSKLPAKANGVIHASSYHVLASLIPGETRSATVLDLGCGDGHLLGLLADRRQPGLDLIGVDMSRAELEAARASLPGDVALLNERAQHLSVESGSVQFVLSHMALMLMDDIEQVFSEIRRVLSSRGTVSFIVGRSFLSGPVKQLYVDALRPIAKDEGAQLRFGDPRTQLEDCWAALLSRSFHEVACTDVDVDWTPSPGELWESLSTTYDVDRLSVSGRAALRERFLAALVEVQEHDGRIRTGWGQRLVTAKARRH
ncbi:class I SAM-dependent methyltransferase [Paraburkholderia sp. BCC1884]|uniref:class I SAM-dependent methyltransferase n=1 Tax=Paraburkholderia sp. BCC1884 TaxID=2562668 RepID=UPI0021B3D541|nr:class I SAM-dependent methyltransferase [Paraburkholderia sp. BCC1884]